MAYSPTTGLYTLPAGASTAVPGAVIQSAVWNNIHSDIGTALSLAFTKYGVDAAETVIASNVSGTTDLSQGATTASLRIQITGVNTITSLGTGANLLYFVRFAGILTLTYNATTLILPGSANITTAAGDEAIFTSDASGNWRCIAYLPRTGGVAPGGVITGGASGMIASATITGSNVATNTLANANLAQMAALTFKGNSTAATANAADLTASALRTAAGLDVTSWRNIIGMAGGLEVWQRGAGNASSIAINASTTQYTADRWYIITGANEASTVSAQAGLTNGSNLCARVQKNNAATGTVAMYFGIPLTTDECNQLRGQNVAISFTVATGANWSPTSGTLVASLLTGTGTEQKAGAAGANFSGLATPVTQSNNLATSAPATRFTAVSAGTIGATVTQAELQFTWTPTGTAGANDWFSIDDVQIEVVPSANALATAFERWPIAECLAHCRRHYRKTFPYATAPAQGAGIIGSINVVAMASAAKTGYFWAAEPYLMRASGTYTTYNPSGATANWQDLTAAASNTATVDPSATQSPFGVLILCSSVAASSDILAIHAQGDAGL